MEGRCAKEEELMDYLEGRLADRERARVEQHLSQCDSCLEELVITGKILESGASQDLEPVPEHVTRRAVEAVRTLSRHATLARLSAYVGVLVSKWWNGLMKPWPRVQPSLAPVRGSKTVIGEDLILLRKSFPNLDVDIEIEKTSKDRASILVKPSMDDKPENPIRVTLFKNRREVSSYLCTGPMVSFEELPYGRYRLVFSRDGIRVGDYPFEIKETRHGRKRNQ